MSALGDHAGSGLDILQTNVGAGGDVDDDAARTGDAGLQQRAGDGSLGGVLGLAGTLGNTDTHVGKAGVLHDGADVREVEVDEGRDVDQAGDALNALTQHIVGGLEGVHQGDLLLTDELQALVRDDDQRVDMHHQGGNALLGLRHLALALKGEGLCDDADGQDAQIMGSLGHDRGSARAGAAAHTGGDKDHLRTLQGVGNLVLALLGGALADLRVGTGTAALGQLGTKLDLLGGLGVQQGLLVGVHCNELDPGQTGLDHAVDSVAAAATYADDLDIGYILHFFVENECHECIPLKVKLLNRTRWVLHPAQGHTGPLFFTYN